MNPGATAKRGGYRRLILHVESCVESTEGPRCMAAAQGSFYSPGKMRLFVLLACCSPPSVSPSLLSSVILSFWNG